MLVIYIYLFNNFIFIIQYRKKIIKKTVQQASNLDRSRWYYPPNR